MSREQLTILGRVIGTYDGWDQGDTASFQFYKYQPDKAVTIPAADCLNVNYDRGTLETYTDDGDPNWSADIITTLRDILKS